MPTKTKAVKSEVKTNPEPEKKNRINLRPLGFKINITYILFILLIIAAFLIGVLVTKVQYLESGTTITNSNDSTYAEDQPQAPTGPVDVSNGHLPTLGNKDAKVTLVEFSDFQCPFCKTLFDESFPQLKKDFIDTGKIKFAYRHYPLTAIHANAQKAAEAAECANDQDKFWDFHDILFTKQAEWESLDSEGAQAKFVEYANNLGLDGATLGECVSSGKFEDNVAKDVDDGNKAGVSGTPATFVNGMLISGAVPYEEFKAEIEKALAAN